MIVQPMNVTTAEARVTMLELTDWETVSTSLVTLDRVSPKLWVSK